MTSSTDGVYQTIQEKTSLSENAKLKKIKQNDLSPISHMKTKISTQI
jgi:hypothetical protein